MARFSFSTQVLLILLYIVFTVGIYLVYTGSCRSRSTVALLCGSFSQRPHMMRPPAWQQAVTDVNAVPRVKVNVTQEQAGKNKRTKKGPRTLNIPTVERQIPHSDLVQNKTIKLAGNKTAKYNHTEYLKTAFTSTVPTASQKHLVQKNKTKPMALSTGPKHGSLKKSQINQAGSEADSTVWNISTANSSGTRAPDKLTLVPVLYKKDFKKMPYWDTNDVYLQSEEPMQTSCAESLRRTLDPDFQQAFLPSIQMYLYKGLLTPSQWNRLALFNNPFGFMEYNYNDINHVVDLIPKPNATQLLPLPGNETCIRCAVVANGGILYGSKMGQEIDSHHYVFRMNGAVVEGNEEDVGNRTSVYVHTAFSLVMSLRQFKKYGFKKIPSDEGIRYVMIPEGLRDFMWLQGLLSRQEVTKGEFRKSKPWTYYEGFDESRFYVLHPDFLRYVRNRFMTSKQQGGKHWALYRPTNGAFTLFLALHVCDTVDAYGFITEDHKNYPNYYFEKDQKTKVIFFINHDYNLEIKTWRKLHNAKVIRLFQREGRHPSGSINDTTHEARNTSASV